MPVVILLFLYVSMAITLRGSIREGRKALHCHYDCKAAQSLLALLLIYFRVLMVTWKHGNVTKMLLNGQETLGDDDQALDGARDLHGDLLPPPDYPDVG